MEKRIFEGIGNHTCGYEEDYINVIEDEISPEDFRKEDVGEYFLGVDEILPCELRVHHAGCARWGEKCFWERDGALRGNCVYRDDDTWLCKPPKFKFKITVETELLQED